MACPLWIERSRFHVVQPAVPQAAVGPETSVAARRTLGRSQWKTHRRVRSPSHSPGWHGVGVLPFR